MVAISILVRICLKALQTVIHSAKIRHLETALSGLSMETPNRCAASVILRIVCRRF